MVQMMVERLARAARDQLMAGRPVVVHGTGFDDGLLVFGAEAATAETMIFTVRHSSGFLCVALPEARCDWLGLPPMWAVYRHDDRTSYTVSVDVCVGASTGISATDRLRTVRRLADEDAVPSDFTRPGHVMVTAAGGHGSRADVLLDLVTAAGCRPAAAFGAIVSPVDPTRMASGIELVDFAAEHGLPIVERVATGVWA
jgi:3,4-dihydroxy 2-butanone 4-phosphate synthase/GTP cyclohydrolase II